jgi:hypothetical protein
LLDSLLQEVSDLTVKSHSEKAGSPEEGGGDNIDPDVVKIVWGHLFQEFVLRWLHGESPGGPGEWGG